MIVQLYFWLDSSELSHSRQVFKLMDWLASFSGIGGLLTHFAAIGFGGFATFNASYCYIITMYQKEKVHRKQQNFYQDEPYFKSYAEE